MGSIAERVREVTETLPAEKRLSPLDDFEARSVTPQVTPTAQAGVYQITLIDLFMPGIWTNTFTITTASEPVAEAVFTFCIDG